MNDTFRIGPSARGIERLEATILGRGFSRHRHDTYAIGITVSGVQTFWYRGAQRYCLPGQCHVLFPDELHDGSPATPAGFSYRITYVDPFLVQQALGGRPLPFVNDPIVSMTPTQRRLFARAWDMEAPIDELGHADIVVGVADALATLSPAAAAKPQTVSLKALQCVRDLLAAAPANRRSMEELERVAGVDRWTLARQFRAAFGTSPTRFRTMRQLDHVRDMVARGVHLADAALQAGFSDQSHMSRMFKRAYGLTPARWVATLAGRRSLV